MSAHSPNSVASGAPPPAKRVRLSSPGEIKDETNTTSPKSLKVPDVVDGFGGGGEGSNGTTAVKASHSSSFRNVSACNRCRLRKNRCDQRLPSCASCEKAGVKCVGYDPITKREIPRR